jgi:hypothetical protein
MARPAGIPLFPPGGRDHREKFRYRMQVGNGPVEDFDCQRRNPMTFIPSAHSSDAPVRMNPPTLRKGDTGAAVEELQDALVDASTTGAMYAPCTSKKDGPLTSHKCSWKVGTFDEDTEDSVKAFQSSKGLGVDGVVGKNTWAALGVKETVAEKLKAAVAPVVPAVVAPATAGKDEKEVPVKVWEQPWFIPVAVGTGVAILGTIIIAIATRK